MNTGTKSPLANLKWQGWIHGAAVVACVLKLLPLTLLSYGCDDDIAVSVSRSSTTGVLKSSFDAAVGMGRFYELVAFSFAQLPYLANNLDVANAFRIFGTGSIFVALWYFAKTLTRSGVFASLAVLFSTIIVYTGPNYNPFHCYPMWFQPPITLTFLSWAVFLKGLRKPSRNLVWFSAFLQFFASLFYEPFVLFGLGHFFLFLWEKREGNGLLNWRAMVRAFIGVLPVFFGAIVYVVAFVIWQKFYPSHYPGSQPSIPRPVEYLVTLWKLTTPAWLFTKQGIEESLRELDRLQGWNVFYVCAFSLAIFFATFKALGSLTASRERIRIALLVCLVALLFVFIPNAVYGLSKQYREHAAKGLAAPYIGTFYSNFFIGVILVGLGVAGTSLQNRRAAQVARVLFSLYILLISISSASRTVSVAKKWTIDRAMWESADLYVNYLKAHRDEIPTDIATAKPDFFLGQAVIIPPVYNYWTHHFKLRLGQKVNFNYGTEDFSKLPIGSGSKYVKWVQAPSQPTQPILAVGTPVSQAAPQNTKELVVLMRKGRISPPLKVKLNGKASSVRVECQGAQATTSADGKWAYLTLQKDQNDMHCRVQGERTFDVSSLTELDKARGT